MMGEVAHRVMTDDLWGMIAVTLIALFCLVSLHQTYRHIIGGFGGMGERVRRRAALCLDRSGFIGAVLARHTVLVTLNILAFNLSLALLASIRALGGGAWSAPMLEWSLIVLAATCVIVMLIVAAITFALCGEVVRLAERTE